MEFLQLITDIKTFNFFVKQVFGFVTFKYALSNDNLWFIQKCTETKS